MQVHAIFQDNSLRFEHVPCLGRLQGCLEGVLTGSLTWLTFQAIWLDFGRSARPILRSPVSPCH